MTQMKTVDQIHLKTAGALPGSLIPRQFVISFPNTSGNPSGMGVG